MGKRRALVDRFWEKFDRPKEGCWEWAGYLDREGYGCIKEQYGDIVYRRKYQAHRLSWMLFFGPIPEGICVLHKCDNRSCVNPDHLFLGTQVDNIKDMINKRRDRKAQGKDHGRAKLTSKDVQQIKNLYKKGKYKQREIADMFSISRSHVSTLVTGRLWKHL